MFATQVSPLLTATWHKHDLLDGRQAKEGTFSLGQVLFRCRKPHL